MSEFFDSEIVRAELTEIHEMQEEVYGNMMSFGSLTREDQLEHIDLLVELLEKQKIMYTRLSLSDDPKAIELRENLRRSVELMGFPKGTDVNLLFDGMHKTIQNLKQQVDFR